MPNEPIINPTPQVACYVIHETQADAFYSPIAVNAEHGLILVLDGWFTIEQKFQTRATQGSVTIVPSGIPYRPIDGEKLHYWLLGFTAASFGLDESHVATAVKKQTGFTVGVWIASARQAKATQLLEHTDLAIDQIAPQIGWQDTTHFIRQFRKI